jgi:arginyl-tRNA synthetase
MTFDIALTKHKVEGFKADKYIWVVGSDQIDHFRRLFAIFALLGLGKIEDFYHLAYGMVRVPEGKMSSRLGNVILADDFLDKVKEMTAKFNPQTAEETAVGAVKYAMLKVNPRLEAVFDLEKSISLEGDSGPYLQYTYARARSVVRRSENSDVSAGRENHVPGPEELSILRFLYRFPEVVEEAARQYAPNLVCAYLFELAKRFNNFYNNVPILQSSVLGSRLSASGQSVIGQPVSETGKLKTGQPGTENRKLKTDNWIFRLALTRAVAQVLKNGLTLLGVPVLEQM